MVSKRRRRRPFRRRGPQLAERKRFVIFCEGTVTEPIYFKALARQPSVRKKAALHIRGLGRKPKRLVQELVNFRKSEGWSHSSREKAGTQYWGVFDAEAPEPHPGLLEAVRMAHSKGIHTAVSNPCFELWLILHFTDQQRWLDSGSAQEIRSSHDGSTGKSLDPELYMAKRNEAARRARELDRIHDQAGRKLPASNPS